MKTTIALDKDSSYQADNCINYTDITMHKQKLLALDFLQRYTVNTLNPSDNFDETVSDWFLAIWRSVGLLQIKPNSIKNAPLDKSVKASLLQLSTDLKTEAELSQQQKILFMNHIELFTGFKNQKIADNLNANKEKITDTIARINDTVKLLVSCDNNAEKIKESIEQSFLNQFLVDLGSIRSKPSKCEIIVVDDKWQDDPEICKGIAMRDRAHKQHNDYAIIITESELSFLAAQLPLDSCDLSSIYKISTLRHMGGAFDVIAPNICDLTAACANSESCSLKEIVLRECHSAGKRDRQEIKYSDPLQSVGRGGEASSDDESASLDESKKITPDLVADSDGLSHETNRQDMLNIFNPSHGITADQWYQFKQKYKLLKTKEDLYGLTDDSSVALIKLRALLRDNTDIQNKIPNLLIKGYFGYVTPYALSGDISKHVMKPVSREKRDAIEKYSPELMYKAVRIPVFDVEPGVVVQHIKRP